jgi:hypothetical protein
MHRTAGKHRRKRKIPDPDIRDESTDRADSGRHDKTIDDTTVLPGKLADSLPGGRDPSFHATGSMGRGTTNRLANRNACDIGPLPGISLPLNCFSVMDLFRRGFSPASWIDKQDMRHFYSPSGICSRFIFSGPEDR